MKRISSLIITLFLLLCTVLSVSAENEITVYVSISNGTLEISYEKISVSDKDGDGSLTINDALYAAHEAKFDGGVTAGYASSEGAYGLKIDKIWGVDNGGSYGYYLNNASAMSLGDKVSDGDHVYAYVYTDLVAWSDTYSFFDSNTKTVKASEKIDLALSASGYDASWNPVTLPLADAFLTVNGEKTEVKTDDQGKASLTFDTVGTYVISAVSETQTLVPPVCIVTVTEKDISNDNGSTDDKSDADTSNDSNLSDDQTNSDSSSDQANPGDSFSFIFVILAVSSVSAFLCLSKKARSK